MALTVALALMSGPAWSQELEPRAYSPSPVGANFVLLAYGRSTGEVIFDPSLPFSDVQAGINATSLVYGRTFGLGGRLASVTAVAPYAWGTISGNVGEERQEVRRSGLADARLRLGINLIGAPALSPREFAQRAPGTILGASVVVVAPTGQYDSSKLINIGANRWATKLELGLAQPIDRWSLELYAGGWFFSENDDFFGGSQRTQQPIASLQSHVSYTFRPRAWVALDWTFYRGGRTELDGERKADLQRNGRLGLTLSFPIGRRNSLKVSGATGVLTRIGGDFDALNVAWQYLWLDGQ